MESRRDWSALNSDLLVEIAVRVPLIEDFMAFRGVCSSWRAAGSKDKFRPPRPSVPLLMLPGMVYGNENDEREFYSLSRRKICMRLPLPETTLKRCLGVGFGWLLIVAYSGDMILLNPFSRAQIQLGYNLMGCEYTLKCIARALLSADPSHTSNFVLLAIFNGKHRLGFWRVGDELWNTIESSDGLPRFADIAYYKEKFYAVDGTATTIWVWDPFGRPNLNKVEVMFESDIPWETVCDIYMVESSNGELLLITSHYKDERFVAVQIMRLDVTKRLGEEIASLENEAVFVGWNASTSMPASAFPDSVEPNRIYFATCGFDYSPGAFGYPDGDGKNMGIYNVEDGSIEWLRRRASQPHLSTSMACSILLKQ